MAFKPILDICADTIYVIRKSVSPFLFLSFIEADSMRGPKINNKMIIPTTTPQIPELEFSPEEFVSRTDCGRR